jgi:hypothetical protein
MTAAFNRVGVAARKAGRAVIAANDEPAMNPRREIKRGMVPPP